MTFDLATHHRNRTRQAEARATMLERERGRLERLLALALRVATSDGRDCPPPALLRVLEQVDDLAPSGPPTEDLVEVLRETNPSRAGGKAAA